MLKVKSLDDIQSTELNVNVQISAENLEVPYTIPYTNNIINGYLFIQTINMGFGNDTYKIKKREITYWILINNVNQIEKNNLVCKVQIPEQIEFLPSEEENEDYNENTRTLTIRIDKLEANEKRIVKVKGKYKGY